MEMREIKVETIKRENVKLKRELQQQESRIEELERKIRNKNIIIFRLQEDESDNREKVTNRVKQMTDKKEIILADKDNIIEKNIGIKVRQEKENYSLVAREQKC